LKISQIMDFSMVRLLNFLSFLQNFVLILEL